MRNLVLFMSMLLINSMSFATMTGDVFELTNLKKLRVFASAEDYGKEITQCLYDEGAFFKLSLNQNLSDANKILEVGGKGEKSKKFSASEFWGLSYLEKDGNDSTFMEIVYVLKQYETRGSVRYNLYRPGFERYDFICYLAPGQDVLKNKNDRLYYTDLTKRHRTVYYNFDIGNDTVTIINNYHDFDQLFKNSKDIAYKLPYIENYIYSLKKEGKLSEPIAIADVMSAFIDQFPFHDYFKQSNTLADVDSAFVNQEQMEADKLEAEAYEEAAKKEADKKLKDALKDAEDAEKEEERLNKEAKKEREQEEKAKQKATKAKKKEGEEEYEY